MKIFKPALFAFMALSTSLCASILLNSQAVTAQETLPWKRQAPADDPYAASPHGDYDTRQPQYGQPAYQTQRQSQTALNSNARKSQFEDDKSYSESEIVDAGHQFFGKVSEGLAKAVETLFRKHGRPTGYILGQDAGGAFIAGLRYGEGHLHTKFGDRRKIFWQGPSLGYDFGGEGSRTMVLVYNLKHPSQIYRRFGGVQGSAYMVGGVGVQLLKNDKIILAPIRAGVGIRFGANVGYLKYTPRPTWNPF